MRTIFIIEHLEPKLARWCLIEYARISSIVGASNLWFTNIKRGGKRLNGLGKVFRESVRNMKLDFVCVLDPDSKQELRVIDKKKFRYFVFGGILGDYPPKKRTKKELTRFLPRAGIRNIGRKQFSTDNAVYVTYEILNGKKLKEMEFVDKPEIRINKIESVMLPFRYPSKEGKPFMSEKLITYLKRKKGF